jgi:hypothetical protein
MRTGAGFSLFMKHIPLTRGRFATVDDGDYEELSRKKWYFLKSNRSGSCDGYAARGIRVNGKKCLELMHRALMGASIGQEVDHRDRDGLNNTRENLRMATRSENQSNRRLFSNNRLGYRGIRMSKSGKRFVACVYKNHTQKYLGSFESIADALHAQSMA